MPSARRETLIVLLGDVILLVLSLWLALTLRNLHVPSTAYFLEHLQAFVFVYIASLLVFYISGLYEPQTRLVKRILGTRILGSQIASILIAAVLFFILPFEIAPKTVLIFYLIISVVLVSAWRFFMVPALSIAERRVAVLIGEGDAVQEVYRLIEGNPKYYIQFVDTIAPGSKVSEIGSLPTRLEKHVANGVRLVVLDSRNPAVRAELPELYDLMLSGVSFVEFSTFYESIVDRVPPAHIDHAWLLEHLPHRNIPYAVGKRALDIVGSALGIIVAAPFVVLAILALLVSGSGAIFIRHERIGRNGKPFRIVKLRTMLLDDHGNAELRAKNRVTGVGKILRKTRVDELPQLWNIFVGDLSFIGPRPELPAIATVYEQEIPYYDVRHLILPGLSGWAQINDYDAPRGGADVERTKRKLSYDMYYLKHRSFGLDLAIALKTLRALLSFSGS